MSESDPYEGSEGLPRSVTFSSKGYRDVIWCPNLREPAILSWSAGGTEPVCMNCNCWEKDTHPFICHILKPSHAAESKS